MEETRSMLKGHFETDDIPTETQYSNLVDSVVNRVDDYKDKSGAPSTSDDVNSGYKKFDIIRDTTNDNFYICYDNSAGAAVWFRIDNEEQFASFLLGVIKSSSSVSGNFASITDWSGSAGSYTSDITYNTVPSPVYKTNFRFYKVVGTDYVEVYPIEVKLTSTVATVTMPVNNDLYVVAIK